MEQTKNEPTKENKDAPDTGKPKKGREPLTEAQRLKRQKMIVLPAMVLVFIGAMWLIFAPSSGKEQPPGTDGYNTDHHHLCSFYAVRIARKVFYLCGDGELSARLHT